MPPYILFPPPRPPPTALSPPPRPPPATPGCDPARATAVDAGRSFALRQDTTKQRSTNDDRRPFAETYQEIPSVQKSLFFRLFDDFNRLNLGIISHDLNLLIENNCFGKVTCASLIVFRPKEHSKVAD